MHSISPLPIETHRKGYSKISGGEALLAQDAMGQADEFWVKRHLLLGWAGEGSRKAASGCWERGSDQAQLWGVTIELQPQHLRGCPSAR